MTETIQEYESKETLTYYFEEENKFQNRFEGYSYEENPLQKLEGNQELGISSCATNGVINTPHFGKSFNTSIFINPRSPWNKPIDVSTISIDISGMQFPTRIAVLILKIEVDLHKNEKVVLCDQMYLSNDINVTLYLKMENCSAPSNQCAIVNYPIGCRKKITLI